MEGVSLATPRVRLEGRLEVVEGAVRRLNEATALLAQPDTREIIDLVRSASSPEVIEAQRAVHAMAEAEQGLWSVLKQVKNARARLDAAITSRLSRLKLSASSQDEALALIAEEPILYEMTPSHVWPAITVSLLALFWCFSGVGLGAELELKLTALGAAGLWFVMSLYRRSNQALVTPKRLLIGDASFPLSELVLTLRGDRRMRQAWEARFSTGGSIGYDVVDAAAIAALRAAGVPEVSQTPES